MFDEELLEKEINVASRNQSSIETLKTHPLCQDKGVAVCCMSIKHAQDWAALAKEHGLKVGIYHTKIDKEERKKILCNFENGAIDCIVSVDALIEGWDSQRVGVLLSLCPTKSFRKASQWLGRGSRKESKDPFLVAIDVLDKGSLGTVTAHDLTHGKILLPTEETNAEINKLNLVL